MNYGFVIDNRKCIGCHACTVACKAEHDVPLGVNRTWVKYIEKGTFPNTRRLFSVMRCNHCDDAPCVEICPVTALFTRGDGIVDFDKQRCIGCKSCMQACPYDALYIDPESMTAAKCNYCAHRIDIGLEPACVNVCPEHAIISGDLDNPLSEISALISREEVQARKVEKGTAPKLFYIDGDTASLVPTATNPDPTYLQTEQTGGVGHFARFAEARQSQADRERMLTVLQNGGNAPEVRVPDGEDAGKMREKAEAVRSEQARRVHDAPSKGVLWGWEVTAYVWTKALAAGAFLVPFLALQFDLAPVSSTLQWAGFSLALLFLTLTGLLLVKDLDQPSRFLYVLLRPQWRSWLVRGGYFLAGYGLLLVAWAAGQVFQVGFLSTLGAVGALVFTVPVAAYTAFLFAQARGRDFWQTPVLPLHMLIHALLAGSALFAIWTGFAASDNLWPDYVRTLLISGLAANLIVLAAELSVPHATSDAKRTVRMITRGRYRSLFYFGVVIAGNLLPLALVLAGGSALLPLAGGLALAGIYVAEHIWVRAPQLIPLS